MTTLPVLRRAGRQSKALNGQDSLLSIVQMPAGIPVGTLAIGERRRHQRRPCWPPPSSRSPTTKIDAALDRLPRRADQPRSPERPKRR